MNILFEDINASVSTITAGGIIPDHRMQESIETDGMHVFDKLRRHLDAKRMKAKLNWSNAIGYAIQADENIEFGLFTSEFSTFLVLSIYKGKANYRKTVGSEGSIDVTLSFLPGKVEYRIQAFKPNSRVTWGSEKKGIFPSSVTAQDILEKAQDHWGRVTHDKPIALDEPKASMPKTQASPASREAAPSSTPELPEDPQALAKKAELWLNSLRIPATNRYSNPGPAEVSSFIPKGKWGSFEDGFSPEATSWMVSRFYDGDRGGPPYYQPRRGEEDDDHPEFIGYDVIMGIAKAHLASILKDPRTELEVQNHEKGMFSVAIRIKS